MGQVAQGESSRVALRIPEGFTALSHVALNNDGCSQPSRENLSESQESADDTVYVKPMTHVPFCA